MSTTQTLRGSCHCGRNQYIIQVPADSVDNAQVIFDSDATQRIASASPLSAFIRVPLSWYHSQTFAFFPDESRSAIRRFYSHPSEQHTMRHFCGFCGTPLSYWSERPGSEADYIQLTLGSLLTEDLHSLDDLGILGDHEDDEADQMDVSSAPLALLGTRAADRDMTSIPWFESMLSGSQLGNVQTSKGTRQSHNGRVRVEWEITEWTEMDDAREDDADTSESSNKGKRKRGEADDNVAA